MAGLVVVTAAPAAAVDFKVPGVSVGTVTAEVNPGTPLYTVELVMGLSAPLDCSVPGNDNAQLRWMVLNSTGSMTRGGMYPACATPTSVLTQVRVPLSMFGFTSELKMAVYAELDRKEALGATNTELENMARIGFFTTPMRPVWIGVGDGYTSAAVQPQDVCTLADLSCQGANLDTPTSSWITQSIATLQSDMGVPFEWQIDYKNFAAEAATGASLTSSASGSQVARMVSELNLRKPAGDRPGSWNWVGVTAGLRDATVMDVLDQWYRTGANAPTATSPNPWAVTGCPDFSSVPGAVNAPAVKGSLQDGLLNVVASALNTDSSVRIVHPLYPNFVDGSSACRPSVVNAVAAINGAVKKASLLARLPVNGRTDLTAAQMDKVFDVDLQGAFGDPHPTGTPIGTSSPIQLRKPFGYPYPSAALGSLAIGISVVDLVTGLQDPEPPVVHAEVRADDPADGSSPGVDRNGWFAGPVTVYWTATDPNNRNADIPVSPTHVTQDGEWANVTSPTVCSPRMPTMCAVPITVAPILIDSQAPSVGVQYYDGLGHDPVYPGSGVWFNDAVTVEWIATNDHEGTVNRVSGWDDSADRPRTVLSAEGANQTASAPFPVCDYARNCASMPTQVNIDKTDPTIVGSVPNTPIGGWFNATNWNWAAGTPKVAWTVSDYNATVPSAVSGVDPVPGTSVAATDGIQHFTQVVVDHAGNTATSADVSVRVDRTAPTVGLGDFTDPAHPIALTSGATITAAAPIACLATDATSGAAFCTTNVDDPAPVDGYKTYTYTLEAFDNAGNSSGRSTFQLRAPASVVLNTPPDTTLLTQPAALTQSHGAAFTFNGSDNQNSPTQLTFQCSLDGGAWTACSSGQSYSGVADGSHTVQVRAVDLGGMTDPTPANYLWVVDSTAPVVNIPADRALAGTTSGALVTYDVTSTDIGGSGVATTVCVPPSGSTFPVGVTTVVCTVTDRAGNRTVVRFKVTVGAVLAGQTFVIGDRSDDIGTTGYYWGAQWWKNNVLSATNDEPPAFKGYADTLLAGGLWTTKPGNAKPPATVPSYLVVIVASNITKSGSTISGNTVARVIIKTESGYGAAPGHVGSGKIVAVVQ
ncbi:MAG: putative internalin [Acidimicrobiales bacterium]|nr:putative internalin [Acidimicrobiales bacterium]